MLSKALTVVLCAVALVAASSGTWIGPGVRSELTGTRSSAPRALKPQAEESAISRINDLSSSPAVAEFSRSLVPELSYTAAEPGRTATLPEIDGTRVLRWHDGELEGALGLTGPGTWYAAVRFTADSDCELTHVRWYQYSGPGGSDQVYVWAGGTPTEPGAVLRTINSPGGAMQWHEVEITGGPLEFTTGQDFWVGVRLDDAGANYWPMGYDQGPMVLNRGGFIRLGEAGAWQQINGFGFDYNWLIDAVIEVDDLERDLAVISVNAPASVHPFDWTTIRATVQNLGTIPVPAGTEVTLQVTGPDSYVQDFPAQVTNELQHLETQVITFTPDWYSPDVPGTYTATVQSHLPDDQNPANDIGSTEIEVSLWYHYADFNAPHWITWAGPERGTAFLAPEFGLTYPIQIERVKTEFYEHSSHPWGTDTDFQFVIYGDDLETELYVSPVLTAVTGEVVHHLPAPVTVTEGWFAVVVRVVGTSGFPSVRADNNPKDRSIFWFVPQEPGDPPEGWYLWGLGELFNAAYISSVPVENDVGFFSLSAPYMRVEPGADVIPTGMVRNYGTNNQFAVLCSAFVVDTVTEAIIYRGEAVLSEIPAGESRQVAFPTWNVPDGNHLYQVYMFSYLPGDENPYNDGVTHLFFGFGVNEPLLANRLTRPVNFDGVIDPVEWSDAVRYDVSNIMGWNDVYRWFPGNIFLYLKYDNSWLYVAVELGYITDDEPLQMGLYIDEDGDGQWAPDYSEGNYWYRSGPNTLQFRGIVSGSNVADPVPVAGPRAAGNASGRMQAEFAIPLGSEHPYQLNIGPGDEFGLWLFGLLEDYGEWVGWWHTEMDEDVRWLPAHYGRVVLAEDAPEPEPGVWTEIAPVPHNVGDRRDRVRRGSWLAFNQGDGLVYATKGNKRQDFFAYDPVQDTWAELASAPLDPARGRPLERGCRGVADGDNTIYMVHGNNTLAFWKYDIEGDTWTALTDVPEGPSRRRVRGGGDMLYLTIDEVGYVYFLKGDRTEFFRYNTETGDWEQLADAPTGIRPRWMRDSWLAYDGDNAIFAHKARYFDRGRTPEAHELWQYDVAGDSWILNTADQLAGMPLLGLHGGRLRNRRARDGGAGVYDNGFIYALKGGNSQQFWNYNVVTNTWTESDTFPTFSPTTGRRRRINAGAYLTGTGSGVFYALKGNRTAEFWRYAVGPEPATRRPERSGVMAGHTAQPVGISVTPSLVTGNNATLRYSLAKAGPVNVNVYDVTGRTVFSRSLAASRTGTVSLDMRSLSAGIYLVKVEADGFTGTRKLVVQR